ncbi:RanGTP-binding protein-domain-containing protein [Syncephalis fuscata]|nr:RanGTP-binding protein-domain-containing protein [Syncephalis fuscata]
MDELFSKFTVDAISSVGWAILGAASCITVQKINNYLKHGQRHCSRRYRYNDATDDLLLLRDRFEIKLKIVTPAIDLVEIIAARGNTALASVLELTTALRRDMDRFAIRLDADIAKLHAGRRRNANAKEHAEAQAVSATCLTQELKALFARIEDTVPFLNLALTTSGANLGTSLPTSVSPSRLMQASSALADCARRFNSKNGLSEELVGFKFNLQLYRVFHGSIRSRSCKDWTWVMEMARCTGRVARVPGGEAAAAASSDPDNVLVSTSDGLEFVYDLVLEEDFNDGLYHEEIADKEDGVDAGEIRGREWRIAVEEVERLYYSSSGRLLNIEGAKHPVLVFKVVRGAGRLRSIEPVRPSTPPPRGSSADNADVDWFAIELYQEGDMVGDVSDEEDEEEEDAIEDEGSETISLTDKSQSNNTDTASTNNKKQNDPSPFLLGSPAPLPIDEASKPTAAAMIGTLSLLEFVVRLSALEVCLQRSHLEAPDEMINLFLKDDQMSKDSVDIDVAASNATSINIFTVIAIAVFILIMYIKFN